MPRGRYDNQQQQKRNFFLNTKVQNDNKTLSAKKKKKYKTEVQTNQKLRAFYFAVLEDHHSRRLGQLLCA